MIALSVITLCIAAISVNVAANIVSPAYDLANFLPKYIDFKRGSYLTAVLALFTFPWKLMENEASVFSFLGTIGGILGPVAGVMLADYFGSAPSASKISIPQKDSICIIKAIITGLLLR